MFVATYQIIIMNPQLGFQIQFYYGPYNQQSILSYYNSKYTFSNLGQQTLIQDIEPYTDSIEISLIFGRQEEIQNLNIQGNMMGSSTTWLLCSLSIREIGCQANCQECISQYLCSTCLPQFNLYHGTCLSQCPGGYTLQYNTCQLDIRELLVQPKSSLVSFMLFDFQTTSDQAQTAFTITSAEPHTAVHSVMSNDATHAGRVFGGLLTFANAVFEQSFAVSNPNYGAIIQLKIYGVDMYTTALDGRIEYDQEIVGIQDMSILSTSSSNIIGQVEDDTLRWYQYTIPLPIIRSIRIVIICTSSEELGYCAVSDFMIILLECLDFCSSCHDAYNCDYPPSILACGDHQQISQDRQSCDDIPMVGCSAVTNSVCQQCDNNFRMINFACQCILGYYLKVNVCDNCDSSCSSCNGPLASDCTTCQDSLLLIQGKCQICQLGCATCVCQTCPTGQLLIANNCFPTIHIISTDSLIYQLAVLGWQDLNDWMTHNQINFNQFCGNGMIESNEQCDDGNLFPFDGCDVYCRFQCHQACASCKNGNCNQCQHGWQVDNGLCSVVYNDGYIVLGYEECDDGNTILYDGCNNGLNQCDKYCQNCSSGRCQNCLVGAQLNNQYICQSVCGDGIVFGNEQCDDGNDVQYDGCYNCSYQCQPQCLNCQQGICQSCISGYLNNQQCYDCVSPCLECDRLQCLTCQSGWYPINNQCQSQCGDRIVAGTEECDQATNCINCIYVLPSNCLAMTDGICKECSTGYQLNSVQYCIGICGDGIIQSNEQCDDGNLRNYDGCSSECQTEFSQIYEVPYMELKQLSSNQPNVQLFQIQFSQQLYYSLNLSTSQLFNISVINTSITTYDIQISEIIRYFTYQVTITFHQTKTQPVLFVQILYDLTNYNNMPLQEKSVILIMQSQYYYSQTELQNLTTSCDVLKYLIYAIISLCALSYLLGKQEVFYNFLDILQRCSYLQQINIVFPYSLQYLFQIFDSVNLNQVFNIFGISIESIYFPYYQSFGKFQKNYNALLLANIFSTILLLSLLFMIYLFGQMIYSTTLDCFSRTLVDKEIQITKIRIYFMQSVCSTIKQIKMINFKEILNSSCYDNTISVLLQLNAIYFNTDIYNITSLSLMVIITIYLCYDFVRIWTLLSMIYRKSIRNSMNINQKYIWSCYYQAILYLKKIAFCINLVCIQSNQSLQILIFIILTLTNLVLVYRLKPFENQQEQNKLIIEESIIVLIYISLIGYIDEVSHFDIEFKNYIAWIDIGLFITCMGVLLIIDLYTMIFIEFYDSFKKFYNSERQSAQPH